MTQRVTEIDRIEQLSPFRDEWWRLLQLTPAATFFQSLEWLEAYWSHYGSQQKLRVLIVSEDDRLLGIVPLVVRREPTKAGPLSFLTFPLDYWGSYYGPIGPEPAATLQAGLVYLKNRRRDWDVLEIRWLGAIDGEEAATNLLLCETGYSSILTRMDETSRVRCDAATWEEYLAARTSKWRTNCRRWQRRLNEVGHTRYERFRPKLGCQDPRWDLYEACEQIAAVSWQAAAADGTTLSDREVRDFLREVHAAAVPYGAVDLNLLYVDDRPAAFAYNYVLNGSVYGLRIGFDPAFAKSSVGNLLYTYALEDSFQRGDHVYDLGPGSLECKRQLIDETRPIWRCSHFAPFSPRAQLLRLRRCQQRDELQTATCELQTAD